MLEVVTAVGSIQGRRPEAEPAILLERGVEAAQVRVSQNQLTQFRKGALHGLALIARASNATTC